MQVSCPSCHERFPLAAGFLDGDGKRLAALLAGMEPVLGRAVIGYLRLFRPPKQGLRTARAVKLVESLQALTASGSVCKDERGGLRRPATAALWAEGIEQMLAEAGKLSLPIANHNYLRAIVFTLADKADALNERQREANLRAGERTGPAPTHAGAAAHSDLHEALKRIETDLTLKIIDQPEAKRRARAAREQQEVTHD